MKIYWNGTSKNIIGPKVKQLRTAQGLSQAALAGRLQLLGMECSDLTILRIEQGSRFVPDYEVAILSEYFNISTVGLFFPDSTLQYVLEEIPIPRNYG